jgi:hypothetical protein
MTLLIGDIDKSARFGNLPQLESFDGLACVPTSITNALLALGINELMQDPDNPSSYNSLSKTRDILGSKYFHTSKKWSSLIDPPEDNSIQPNLLSLNKDYPTPYYYVAEGSVPSLVIKGTLDYIEYQRKKSPFSTPITVSTSGLIKGNIAGQNFNFTGFDLQNKIDGNTITTPTKKEYERYFNELIDDPEKRGAGVLDLLMQGLLRGPIVFAMYYTGQPGGHAVVASSIKIDDKNANGWIDEGEGQISFIDPLHPSQGYEWVKGVVQGKDSFRLTEGNIWQSADGFLKLSYDQRSVVPDKDKGTFNVNSGDTSNNTFSRVEGADITLAMALNTSGLAPDFDKKAGALSARTPGLVDFSFLLNDPETKDKTLNGYAYSNEESAFSNDFLYYEILDARGTITTIDPITGQKLTITPGDDGYISTAWTLAEQQSSGLGPISLEDRTSTDKEILTAFSVDLSQLTTGYLAPIAMTSDGNIFTPFAQANSDMEQHFKYRGPLSWGLEDQLGLGDKDHNDLHVIVLIKSIV